MDGPRLTVLRPWLGRLVVGCEPLNRRDKMSSTSPSNGSSIDPKLRRYFKKNMRLMAMNRISTSCRCWLSRVEACGHSVMRKLVATYASVPLPRPRHHAAQAQRSELHAAYLRFV